MIDRVEYFKQAGKMLEAQRIEQRTRYDLEMLREVGFCSGIENYSRIMSRRAPGSTPYTLLDFFPKDFLLFVDESHVTLPQVRGMSGGDRARKTNLVEYGFRLPSAYDNRPLFFDEFDKKLNQVVYVSATPGTYELQRSTQVVEQIIRPTGLPDPVVEVRPIEGQVDDLMGEIRTRAEKNERVLVTTMTKKMAEDLCEYLEANQIRVRYIHHNVETIERMEIIRDLRLGKFDVLVGINLLREGLDIPEVSLVAILDADKEGMLRSATSLVQTIGRAARNAEGRVIMYGDTITSSMRYAIDETNRRRQKQLQFNAEHGIVPKTIVKPVHDIIGLGAKVPGHDKRHGKADNQVQDASSTLPDNASLNQKDREALIAALDREMRNAAKQLEFERAAYLRDKIKEYRANDDALQTNTPAKSTGKTTGKNK